MKSRSEHALRATSLRHAVLHSVFSRFMRHVRAPVMILIRYPSGLREFKVTEPELNDAEDRKLAAEMPSFIQGELVRRLRESGLFTRIVNANETDYTPGAEKTLMLEGEITRLAPGSRALRYFVGFGAGRSKTQAETRFVDAQSGQPVLVIADRRVAAYGIFGGDSREHLRESFDDMARDLAKFLIRLSRGEAPKKE